MPLLAGVYCTLVCIETRKLGQQGRMDVQYAPFESIDEGCRQDAHESCEDYQLRLIAIETLDECRIIVCTFREILVPDTFSADSGFARTLQSVSARLVTEYDREIEIESTCGNFVDDGLQV